MLSQEQIPKECCKEEQFEGQNLQFEKDAIPSALTGEKHTNKSVDEQMFQKYTPQCLQ